MTPALNDTLHRYADHIGVTAARAVDRTWSELWRAMRPGPLSAAANYQRALALLATLPHQVHSTLRAGMGSLLYWSYGEAGRELLRRIPADRIRRVITQHTVLHERWEPATLFPEVPTDPLQELLFPPLGFDQVHDFLSAIIPAGGWTTIGDSTSGATPQLLATVIANRYAAGDDTREVAKVLLPYFDGSRVRATRAARTYGAYVGTNAGLAATEQLGTLVAGYSVHDPGGPTARPDHVKRSGTRYMREPGSGEFALDVMPQPPLDRGGPDEDGSGVKWNCRCYLTPILAE